MELCAKPNLLDSKARFEEEKRLPWPSPSIKCNGYCQAQMNPGHESEANMTEDALYAVISA
jgi:hypothetical protein